MKQLLFLSCIFSLFISCDNPSSNDNPEYNQVNDSILGETVIEDSENYNGENSTEDESNTENDGRVQCPSCNGNGTVTCSSCDGNGKRHCRSCGGDGWDNNGQRCLNCDGRGIVTCSTTETCSPCQGYGYGYLVPCTVCNGTTKKEDGTSCICVGQFSSLLTGMFGQVLNVPGVIFKDYPGYYFTYPNP